MIQKHECFIAPHKSHTLTNKQQTEDVWYQSHTFYKNFIIKHTKHWLSWHTNLWFHFRRYGLIGSKNILLQVKIQYLFNKTLLNKGSIYQVKSC